MEHGDNRVCPPRLKMPSTRTKTVFMGSINSPSKPAHTTGGGMSDRGFYRTTVLFFNSPTDSKCRFPGIRNFCAIVPSAALNPILAVQAKFNARNNLATFVPVTRSRYRIKAAYQQAADHCSIKNFTSLHTGAFLSALIIQGGELIVGVAVSHSLGRSWGFFNIP